MKCQIKWIDKDGKATPDENEATALVYREEYDEDLGGQVIHYTKSEDYPICAWHLHRLDTDPYGMRHWKVKPLQGEENTTRMLSQKEE